MCEDRIILLTNKSLKQFKTTNYLFWRVIICDYFICMDDYFICMGDYFVCMGDYFICMDDYFICMDDYFICMGDYLWLICEDL